MMSPLLLLLLMMMMMRVVVAETGEQWSVIMCLLGVKTDQILKSLNAERHTTDYCSMCQTISYHIVQERLTSVHSRQ